MSSGYQPQQPEGPKNQLPEAVLRNIFHFPKMKEPLEDLFQKLIVIFQKNPNAK